jgi:hypothetical protein
MEEAAMPETPVAGLPAVEQMPSTDAANSGALAIDAWPTSGLVSFEHKSVLVGQRSEMQPLRDDDLLLTIAFDRSREQANASAWPAGEGTGVHSHLAALEHAFENCDSLLGISLD